MKNKKKQIVQNILKKKVNIFFIKLDGKSYKLNKKKTAFNFRFNKSNINVLVLKNIKIIPHKFKKKIYIYTLLVILGIVGESINN